MTENPRIDSLVVTTKYLDLTSYYVIPTTHYNNFVSHYDDLLTCGNDILYCGNVLLTCGNELKYYRKTVLCPFLGSVNTGKSKASLKFKCSVIGIF